MSKRTITLITAAIALATIAFVGIAAATTATCNNPATLSGSAFEIDTDANLVVNTTGCIDWLANGTGSAFRSGVLAKNDTGSGANDDSFGQGTSENDANPTIVTGSIPPNKSDLKAFGVFTETQGTAQFLELFWSRVQSPQGTTNMDFELNKIFCDPANPTVDTCADNGVTPVRSVGDKLITYDLSRGGTVPTISIRTWNGSAWSSATVISGGSNPDALGSVNTSTIAAADSGGLGSLDPFTFGEAAISFEALFGPNACGQFGSAYLKSRSSDSFTAEIKDFVPPERVNIRNCPAQIATEQSFFPNDTATITGTGTLTGTVTFTLYRTEALCQADTNNDNNTAVYTESKTLNSASPVTVSTSNNQTSTPTYKIEDGTKEGAYFWGVSYSGDANNDPARTCVEDSSVTINNT